MKIIPLIISLLLTVAIAHATDDPIVPVQSDDRDKALIQSAFDGELVKVQGLVKKGASVEATDPKSRTALMWAAANGHTPVIEFLLGQGADINAMDSDGQTALMYATRRSSAPTVKFLLANGAGVNFQSKKSKFTALIIAASGGNVEIVRLLLEYGADTSLAEGDGDTPLARARQYGHSDIAALLNDESTLANDP